MRKVEYGIKCRIETFWPQWSQWNVLSWFRIGRWYLARWLAKEADTMNKQFAWDCGTHTVVRRE